MTPEEPQEPEETARSPHRTLGAEHALILAEQLAASLGPTEETDPAVFFGLAEAGRAEKYNTAARFFWRQLVRRAGEERYVALRSEYFGEASEATFSGSPKPFDTDSVAGGGAILKQAYVFAAATAQSRVHLRHLVASLIGLAEEEPPSSSAPLPTLFRKFDLDIPSLKKQMFDWLAETVTPDELTAWRNVLAIGPDASPDLLRHAELHSIQRSAMSDNATREDSLGFRPTVRAVADFLRHPETKPPLTMSVEGEWGSGKSSFMMQLEQELQRPSELAGPAPFVVWFDAWRHADNEEMWATFAVEFLHQIAAQQTLFKRAWGHFLLFVRRVKWRDVRLEVLRAVLFGVAAILIVLALVQLIHAHWAELAFARNFAAAGGGGKSDGALEKLTGKLIVAGGWTGALGLAVLTLTRVKDLVGGALPFDLKKHVDSPDYEGRSTFLDQFHKDFAKIVDAYLGPRRVYVFIDDLDRCEVPTAVVLMQAINLMTACTPKLIFIIGMDREKVAAGVAAKYAPVLPYLRASSMPSGRAPRGKSSELDALHGVAFGLDFIEKFIQLRFSLPRPTAADTRQMLWSLAADRDEKRAERPGAVPSSAAGATRKGATGKGAAASSARKAATAARPYATNGNTVPPPSAPPSSLPRHTAEETARFASAVSTDSALVHDITLALAPALDFNPRRVKQFLNLFRLRAFLAWQTGHLDDDDHGGTGRMTLPQLGKLTAIALRWPLLIADLEADPMLLARLQAYALGTGEADTGDHASAAKWFEYPKLLELLRFGSDASLGDVEPEVPSMLPDYDVAHMTFAWSVLGFSRSRTSPPDEMTGPSMGPSNGAASEPSPSIRVPPPASAQ